MGNRNLDCAFVTFYYPPALGGLERYLYNLAGALDEKIEVAVLAGAMPRPMSRSKPIERTSRVETIRRPMLAGLMIQNEFLFRALYPFACFLVFFWTLATLGGRYPKLICAGSADFAWPVALAARLLRADFAFICHGKDGNVRPGWFSHFAKAVPLAFSIRRAKVCLANSRYTASLLDPHGDLGDKLKVLYPPIEPLPGDSELESLRDEAARFIKEKLSHADGPDDARVLLSVGRLREHKGFQHVLLAMQRVAKEFPDLVYVIVGSGPYETALRNEIKNLGLESRVVLVGQQNPPTGFYALADLFVTVTYEVPAEPEGFGMVFIEAARSGVPSIAGNIGGMPEAVRNGKTGFCVPGANPKALADSLRLVLGDDSLRATLGAEAQEFAKDFEPGRIAEKFMAACGLRATKQEDPDPAASETDPADAPSPS